MKNQFDEMAKSLCQSVTRRAALKKFGVGIAGVVLAWLGLANDAYAARGRKRAGYCYAPLGVLTGNCISNYDTRTQRCYLSSSVTADCPQGAPAGSPFYQGCDFGADASRPCSFR